MALSQEQRIALQEELALATYEELVEVLENGPEITELLQAEINKRNTTEAPEQLDLFN